ncbi:ABC transporter permease [Kytococcus sedentarius]|uniref:ABC-type dipeptide/oligopeptide/nickel transport system, permease component n=1 Tax=Kytococcus sedentarius (strain ATCC 14392 / DSM 20547 / JCM 11482 / CCUG 33030 / NBRC 15357 / NCTC 11040 / CCM 314 / 541) TaxID=478801 RepID=C7NKI9_KYTSD|nr:ABC transporter permease [Kytococcus sedentarius]ACV05475.1 ABC-type dipeptide/oligopeptide/nickel transport system, permease component [Kytococcus sedentarius DSM 20547]QQB63915.1 ABC transporter permease [Kytococcus sedentarius]
MELTRIGRMTVRRLAWAVPVTLVVSLAVFALASASPLDPLEAMLGDRYQRLTPEQRAVIGRAAGTDAPWWQAWWWWLTDLLRGDLGFSRVFRQPVAEVLLERVGWTVLLTLPAMALALVLGLAGGVAAGLRPRSWWGRLVTGTALVLQALPPYVLAMVAILLFAVAWGLLPSGGLGRPGEEVTASGLLRHATLPVVVLALSQLPWLVLAARESVAETMTSDAVRGARARGLSARTIRRGHVVPPALVPVATLVGLRLPELVVGAVIVEEVFAWPGVASAMVDAALELDFPLLAALTTLTTVLVLVGSWLADVVHLALDPRVEIDA